MDGTFFYSMFLTVMKDRSIQVLQGTGKVNILCNVLFSNLDLAEVLGILIQGSTSEVENHLRGLG